MNYKICAISDTHNQHRKITIPPCDFLISAGDATNRGTVKEIADFLTWFGQQPAKYKLFTPGNHDWLFQKDLGHASEICIENNVILLLHEARTFQGINFFMSPYTPFFHNWAFNVQRGDDLKELWDMIPDDTDVLITHGPAYGILDEVLKVDGSPYEGPRYVGCEMLAERLKTLKISLHLFGHIHSSYGQKHKDGISFYNLSNCDEMYYPSNPITIIEYNKEEG